MKAIADKSSYYKLNESCKIVIGILRSAIYDLQRGTFILIPSDFANKLNRYQNQRIDILVSAIDSKYRKNYTLLISRLINEEILLINQSLRDLKRFTTISNTYSTPNQIINSVLFIDYVNSYKLEIIFKKLIHLGCKYLQLQIDLLDTHSHEILIGLLKKYNFFHIEILINRKESVTTTKLIRELCKVNSVIDLLVRSKKERNQSQTQNVIIKTIAERYDFNGMNLSPNKFDINYKLYFESLKYNNYYYRKLFISQNGTLYNDNNRTKIIGDLRKISNKNIDREYKLRKYWHLTKDQIEVCKDCEYRYMCVDNRQPIKSYKGKWYFKIECNYNPYIGKWKGEDGYLTLTESGVLDKGFNFKSDSFRLVLSKVWN